MSFKAYQQKRKAESDLMRRSRKNRNPIKKVINRGTYKSELYGKPEKTQEGFLVVPVVIAQKAVLDYPEYGRNELLGDDIFSDEYIKSCDGCPFVLDHPKDGEQSVDVMPSNFNELITGIVYDPIIDKENNRVLGKLKIFDPYVIELIESGEMIEVSQGYTCKVRETQGSYNGEKYEAEQFGMLMNHLALVDNGRAGNAVKVLYNNSKLKIGTNDVILLNRRRQNMFANKFKKLNSANQEEILKRINEMPEDDKAEAGDITPINDDVPGGSPIALLEQKVDKLYALIEKLAGGAVNAEDDKENAEDEPAKDPKPEDKVNEDDKEKDIMNKVTNSMRSEMPKMISGYMAEQSENYMKAQVLIGEGFQELAIRSNSLPEFRKSVLVQAGLSKEKVSKMNSAQTLAYLDVMAETAKFELNSPSRINRGLSYSETGDRMVESYNQL